MNAQPVHHQLLAAIRDELAVVGYALTVPEQDQMAFVLDRLDRIRSREEAALLSLELEGEPRSLDAGNFMCAVSPLWLRHTECA